ncbi:MAG: HNH endonuclease, partial [Candidatus Rokuibacteriota bacterium]
FQRYAHDGFALLSHPRLQKEISAGRLTFDRAMFAVDHASGIARTLQSWLALVRRLGRTEMERAWRQERDHDVRLREVYAPLLVMAREVEAKLDQESILRNTEATAIGGTGGEAEASAFDTTAERIAAHLRTKGVTGKLQVALRDDADRRSGRTEPDSIRVRRGLLAAADYLLTTVELTKLHGPRKTIARDRYTCQNPRCRRRTLRVHHHHLVERQHGGSDEPWNTVTGCPACHLRGIHSKRMSVVRLDDWLVWTWPDGGAVLMHSPVDEAP